MKIAVAGATGRVGRHVVDVLEERGHLAVPMSRSTGVDVITGDGLAEALAGVHAIVDAATGPSPDEQAAAEFFTASARNLKAAGAEAGAKRLVVVSIVGTDRFTGGYGAAKQVHEREALAGPLPAVILRATQFHEFVEQLVDWGRQGDVAYVAEMRTQLVAARNVAEALADLATADEVAPGRTVEIGGPRPESLVEMARLLVATTGERLRIEAVPVPPEFYGDREVDDGLLPGPGAALVGPTYEEWLAVSHPKAVAPA
jgi:uncharacterized protein YbjT (DUF2867 family)